MENKKYLKLYSDKNFIVSQCSTINIPGYLIIESIQEDYYLYKKQVSSWKTLGILLAKIEEELYKTLQPENIYFCKFGEENKKIHFHVFPRTREITRKYFEHHPNTGILNGPQIFDWARREYRVKEGCFSEEVIRIANKINIEM